MNRNIKLATLIFSLDVAWFWLGIWVPYYLLFTNYAGIGIIETIVVASAFLLEIPTGAFSDLVGKKKTLLLVFAAYTLGDIVLASAQEFWHILISVILLGSGVSLLSGTKDAFIYDTLLTLKQENTFETVLSRIQKYGLILMAAASAIGGWMYTISPSLPYWAMAVVHGLCLLLTLFLIEPPIDTDKFSIPTYLRQMRHGVSQLFSGSHDHRWLFQLLVIGALVKFLYEGLDPAIGLALGLPESYLGYLYALVPLVSAAGAHLYEKHSTKKTRNFWWHLITATMIITPILSPFIGITLGVALILGRNFFYPILETVTSNSINRFVASKYRATTLSAFNMLVSLPYVLGAALFGRAIDIFGALPATIWLTIIFFASYLLTHLIKPSRQKTK